MKVLVGEEYRSKCNQFVECKEDGTSLMFPVNHTAIVYNIKDKDMENNRITLFTINEKDKPICFEIFEEQFEFTFEKKGVIKAGILEVDKAGKLVYINGIEVYLTRIERDLLLLFLENQNKVLDRSYILSTLFRVEHNNDKRKRILCTHIKNLRRKIGDASSYIKTISGIGYKFRVTEHLVDKKEYQT